MLKPSGGFLKKLFDPARMAQKKKAAPTAVPSAASSGMARREQGGGGKGIFGKAVARKEAY
jgi:hypothetical protein